MVSDKAAVAVFDRYDIGHPFSCEAPLKEGGKRQISYNPGSGKASNSVARTKGARHRVGGPCDELGIRP